MRVLEAARRMTAQLKAGDVVLQPSAQGPRLTLLLLAGSQVVGSLLLDERGVIHPPADGPMLPDAALPANLNALRPKLAAQVEALTLSGAVDVLPQGYGVTLLLGGQSVGQLRFAGGDLQPIPGRLPPPGGHPARRK